MEDVTVAHAKEHLEELIARVARGADVRIVDQHVGSVRLVSEPSAALRKPRRLGLLEGKMKVPARLLEPMTEEELNDWYGDSA